MKTHVSRRRRLLVMMAATGVAVAVAVNAFATGAAAPATTTICIKPNGQLRAVTPENPVCVTPEAANEWTVNGVKAISAGAGLVGRDDGGVVQLEVDPGLIENANSGKIIAGFDDGPGEIPGVPGGLLSEIARLPLPAGAYAISAKLTVVTDLEASWSVRCRLEAGPDFDESRVELAVNASPFVHRSFPMALEVVHRFPESGFAVLRCGTPAVAGFEDLKIVAIRGSSLSNTFLGE